MSFPEIEKIVLLDQRIGRVIDAPGIDNARALFDEYRTTNESDRDAFVLALAARTALLQTRARIAIAARHLAKVQA